MTPLPLPRRSPVFCAPRGPHTLGSPSVPRAAGGVRGARSASTPQRTRRSLSAPPVLTALSRLSLSPESSEASSRRARAWKWTVACPWAGRRTMPVARAQRLIGRRRRALSPSSASLQAHWALSALCCSLHSMSSVACPLPLVRCSGHRHPALSRSTDCPRFNRGGCAPLHCALLRRPLARS